MMYSKGDIVIIEFPFSDLMNAKKRPIVVLAERGDDIVGCAITSNPQSDGIPFNCEPALPLESKIKYWQIHTLLKNHIVRKAAKISSQSHRELLHKINQFFSP